MEGHKRLSRLFSGNLPAMLFQFLVEYIRPNFCSYLRKYFFLFGHGTQLLIDLILKLSLVQRYLICSTRMILTKNILL